jgi:hypothetical protein|tara:strand:+ start:234 stop:425 length:192 start_codon:yes stop_codon:yes gene_type:complete
LIHYIVNPDSRKSIDWRGSTLKDIRNDKIFSYEARKQAGHQLSLLQDRKLIDQRYKAVLKERQ